VRVLCSPLGKKQMDYSVNSMSKSNIQAMVSLEIKYLETYSSIPVIDLIQSGWLSFFKAVKGTSIQKEDNTFGMRRVEIITKKYGAHLGHVFNYVPWRQTTLLHQCYGFGVCSQRKNKKE